MKKFLSLLLVLLLLVGCAPAASSETSAPEISSSEEYETSDPYDIGSYSLNVLYYAAELQETLGGFKPGDNYPDVLGNFPCEYDIIWDKNGWIFWSPGNRPMPEDWWAESEYIIFWGMTVVKYIRSSSPEFGLGTGFKPGDAAKAAIDFYTDRYGQPEIGGYDDYNDHHAVTFPITIEGIRAFELTFTVSDQSLTGDSVIEEIELSSHV